MKKRLGIYPYTNEWKPVLHHKDFLFPDYEVEVATLNQYAYPGIEGVPCLDWETMCTRSDIILLADACEGGKPLERIPDVKKVFREGMHIKNCFRYGQDDKELLGQLSKEKHILFEDFCSHEDAVAAYQIKYDERRYRFHKLSVPVVFVLGLFDNLDKFAVQLALRRRLQNDGYKLCQIGTRNYCECFGFHSFPGFMRREDVCAETKTVWFHEYLYSLVETEVPDIVVVGIPGAYRKINDSFSAGFGMAPYIVSQSITPDYAIMCSFFDNRYNEEFYDMISTGSQHHLGFPIDCYHMSSNYIDFTASYEAEDLRYCFFDDIEAQKTVNFYCREAKIPIISAYDDDGVSRMMASLLDKLASPYEEVDAIW